jgi:polysaccharide biosynthesis/export protein
MVPHPFKPMVTTMRFPSIVHSVCAAAVALLAVTVVRAQSPALKPIADDSKAPPYRIAHGDVVSVAVFGESDLVGGNKRVEPNGTINLPLIGDIRIASQTKLQAQTMIAKAYVDGRFLRDPKVTITIDIYAPRRVSIMGKINQPATYDLPADAEWTLKDLVLKAGGFGETAKGTAVRVTRTMPDGTIKTFEFDIDSVIKGKKSAKSEDASFVLEPGDIIYVPEKII